MAGDNTWRGIGVAAVFALIGPLAGATGVLLVLAGALLITDPGNGVVTLLMWPFAAVLGMMIGFAPGLLTGVVMSLLSSRLVSRRMWVGAAAVCGVLMTGVFYRLADLGQDPMIVIGCGGGAAAACALITMNWRPRNVV